MKPFAFIVLLATQLIAPAGLAGEISLVVTVHPLALLVEQIGGERVEVHVLVPPGASPHEFEPRPSDLVLVSRANAFIKVGGGAKTVTANAAALRNAFGADPKKEKELKLPGGG